MAALILELGIVLRPGSFSDRWVEYRQREGIPFMPVDPLRPDFLGRVRSLKGLAWHWSHTDLAVAATSLPLAFDATRFPDRLALLEIEASSPPGYPLLSVYCYDFAEARNPALFEKTLELEGEGLRGERVTTSLSFASDAPDVSARSVRFPFPVRLDRPFRQRVSETDWSGEQRVTEWSRARRTGRASSTSRPRAEES